MLPLLEAKKHPHLDGVSMPREFHPCSSAVDVFHANMEVEVRPSLEQVLDFYNQPMEGSLEDFLALYDPIFQETLELIQTTSSSNTR